MKRLPIKSLIQFRSVSKPWNSLITSSDFIADYHNRHTQPPEHIFVCRKEVVFAVDISESMQGNTIEITKNAIIASISKLNQEDFFGIMTFNDQTHLYSSNLQLATHESIRNASEWIDTNFVAGGGTNISDALDQALEMFTRTSKSIPMVFFVTDGAVENERQICKVMQKKLRNKESELCPRINTFGIGSYCNHYFLRILATISKGHYDASYDADSFEVRMQTWFLKASSIMLTNIVIDGLDDLKNLKTTPPDSDVYGQSKIDKSLGGTVKPTSKPALNSCSRMKVLQNPTSFSHRRLLPYLMSVSGNNLSTLKSNQSLKLEKVTEENRCQNVSMNESKTDGNIVKPSTTDEKSDSPTSTLIPVDTSFNIMKTVTSVSSERNLDAGGQNTVCSGSTPQLEVNLQAVKAVESDSSIKLEQSSPKNNLESVEVAVSKATVMSTEQSIDTNDGKERPHQSSLQITPVNALGLKSGILKRTPRGCRGICNCLNCTSFRLHAERSFEFSRNQMHDAEDVALELINDLSSLRTILEKTASDCKPLDTDKEKQVKEACEKALYKEEVARARLAQMNEDLSIHCRSMKLLRPNVTFANKTEEKVISRDHVYEKKSI